MSWSTFWRKPDEKKFEPLVLICDSEAMCLKFYAATDVRKALAS